MGLLTFLLSRLPLALLIAQAHARYRVRCAASSTKYGLHPCSGRPLPAVQARTCHTY